MGTMGTTCGDHRPWRPHGDLLGTTGTHGDDVGMTWDNTGTMWDDGDDDGDEDDGDHMGTTKSLKMP